jgi:opacity protein-like surface antigen/outer membrane protease
MHRLITRIMYRLIVCIAAIGLVHAAAAEDADSAYVRYLRGLEGYAHPTSAPAPSSSAPAPSYRPIFKAPVAPAPPPPWLWTGFYIGPHVGATVGTADFADPFGSSIFGDKVATPGFLAGGQVGYNWQAPNSNWVLGVEAAASWLSSDGTNTCLASSGLFVSATCHADPNAIATLTARGGYALGPSGRTLIYAKGGVAFVHDRFDIATNATPSVGLAPLTTSSGFTRVGWTVGAGVEHAIAPAWSVKVEYDFVGLGGQTVATPPGLFQLSPGSSYNFSPAGAASVSQNLHEVNLGLNYKFGMDPLARWVPAPSGFPVKAPVTVVESGWDVEAGARYWYSSGRFQKDLGSTAESASATTLNSRLTYVTTANSGEFFGRADTPSDIFVKGNIGAGSLSSGHMNDEDWAIPPGFVGPGAVAYSNTLSNPITGGIDYATVDLGYDFFRGAGNKLGPFVGYNYYKENKSAYGCTQIANPISDCVPAIAGSVLVITENDTWSSVRLGVNGEFTIADRFKLGADIAFLPYLEFNGTDNHVLRALVSPESGIGRGVQLEGILSYLITDQFSVGVGGRYWAMWTTRDAVTEFGGAPCPCNTLPAKTERYGAFLQAAYKFGAWRRASGSGPVEWSPF